MTRFLVSWGPALLWAGVIFWLSAQTWEDGPAGFQVPDKLAHLILFGILGVTLAWGGRDLRGKRVHLALLSLGTVYALSDEWHQAFVPLREPSAGDFLADLVGIVVAYVITRAFMNVRRKGA
jgi:VanZ family protein